jgi:hypothetical protein
MVGNFGRNGVVASVGSQADVLDETNDVPREAARLQAETLIAAGPRRTVTTAAPFSRSVPAPLFAAGCRA